MSNDLWNFQSHSCLAVGQKPNMRHLVREMLHGVGLSNLEFVTDIHAAMAVVSGGSFDVVLLEVVEPVGTAVKFIEDVRRAKKPVNCALSIIASHAQLEEGSAEKLRDAGVTELLAMPVSRKLLLETMDATLKRPRSFINTSVYCGPDRRRGQPSDYKGPKRREVDRLAEHLAEVRAKTESRARANRNADIELVAFLCDTTVEDAEKRITNDKSFATFLCEGSQEEAHFTDMIDLEDIAPPEEPEPEPVEFIEPPPEEPPEEDVEPPKEDVEPPKEDVEPEEGAMTQAELAARLNKNRPKPKA